MPHRTAFDSELGVVVIRFAGEFTLAELERVIDEIPARPWFHAHLKMVADMRDCTTAMTGKEVQTLATYAKRRDLAWGDTKWAVLAPSDLIYGLSRIYMALTADYHVQTHAFRAVEEANDWLDLGVSIDEIIKGAA